MGDKTRVPKLAAVYAATPLDTLKAWQAFHVVDGAAPFLAKPFADAWFDMHDKTLSGQAQQRVRWKRAVQAVGGSDSAPAAASACSARWVSAWASSTRRNISGPRRRRRSKCWSNNLLAAYHARLEKLDWMSPATKAEALKKLETYTVKVGYPDNPRDYSKLVVTDDDLVGDVRRAAAGRLGVLCRPLQRPGRSLRLVHDAANQRRL